MSKYVKSGFSGYADCEKEKEYYIEKGNRNIVKAVYMGCSTAWHYFKDGEYDICIKSYAPIYESKNDIMSVLGIVDAMKKDVKIPGPQYGVRVQNHR